MCPNDPPPDRPVFGNASAGDPLEIRYLSTYSLDRNDESGFVVAVRVTLAARAPYAYRAEVADALRALYPQAEVVVV